LLLGFSGRTAKAGTAFLVGIASDASEPPPPEGAKG
jgi:hypothetical protein